MRMEWQIAFWLAVLLLFGFACYMFANVLAPFIASLALGYVLDPVVSRLQRLGLNRLAATLVILAIFLVVVVVMMFAFGPILGRQLIGFAESLPEYANKLQSLIVGETTHLLHSYGGDWLKKLGIDAPATADEIQKSLGGFLSQGTQYLGNFLRSLWSGGQALVGLLALAVVTPVVTFYLLLSWPEMVSTIRSLIPPRYRATVFAISVEIDRALSGFLRGQSLVCLFLGAWYGVGLSLIGLNFGFFIGISAGFLSFIPYVGSTIALVFSVIVAVVQGWPHLGLLGLALLVVGSGQFLEGNVLSPKLVGESVGLHPVWLIFALFAFANLMGFAGMIIAVPLAAAMGVLIRFVIKRYKQSSLFSGVGLDAA
ncbi:AI-2E family transporter [Rhodoblastus acidophilus]|uniref:AI-2E family transporter n=1 Tax=Candidatus Rhodoblastus alkanivorans TaxID=2954117 RepID=A0ABS9Z943_9HYPH|nr:AI-2E family transporter [Candidatus Rhodoblastus alkanivorans]MCI4677970.1 AI-2E family transporter [Candidatus Rhodoblastus alkanivorans]MCI4683865.1 AI-2E family transporter [Candidatus Rhodoblastus alkanivorans]